MQAALTTYFDGEKNAGLLITGIGVAALVLAAVFLQPRWGLRSFAVTLAVIALAEIAIGVGLYLRGATYLNEIRTRSAALAAPASASPADIQATRARPA
jgi:hypothetical protein